MSGLGTVPFFGQGPTELPGNAVTLIQDQAGSSAQPAVLVNPEDVLKLTNTEVPQQVQQIADIQRRTLYLKNQGGRSFVNPTGKVGFSVPGTRATPAGRVPTFDPRAVDPSGVSQNPFSLTLTSGKQVTGYVERGDIGGAGPGGRDPRVAFGFANSKEALDFATFVASKTGKNVVQGFQDPNQGFVEQAINELGSLISLNPTRSRTAASARGGTLARRKQTAGTLAL